MGETTDQIETHLEDKREDLSANLRELTKKVKWATDWRQQFQNHSMTMIGVAFGGGVLLAAMMGGNKRQEHERESPSDSALAISPSAGNDPHKQKLFETWDNIKGALIGVTTTQIKSFLGDKVPGFQEHLDKIENEKTRSSLAPATSQEPQNTA